MDHEMMMKVLHEIFDPSMPQLAPGDTASTRSALEILYGPELDRAGEGFRAVDIGCGNGRQTLRLAAELGCPILATDIHQPYLDELERRAAEQGFGDLIETLCADMNGLDLGGETFDLVWAEGSAFVVGVREALTAWRSFLKPGGAIGFTELTWLREDVPQECRQFFDSVYPAMTNAESLLAMIAESGYETAGHFTLPESSWSEQYLRPLVKRLDEYETPPGDEAAAAILDMVRKEIDIYRKHSKFYGYEFFLLRA